MGEFITDNFKAEAMKLPVPARPAAHGLDQDRLATSPSPTSIRSRPISAAPAIRRKAACRSTNIAAGRSSTAPAEIAALLEVPHFIARAHDLYGYDNFIADTGGSLIEVVDLDDPKDPVIKTLSESTTLIYIRGTEKDAEELVRRFAHSPKPMYYQPPFLTKKWAEYKKLNSITDDAKVDPNEFGAWGFEALLHDRLPRYQKLADNFGYTDRRRRPRHRPRRRGVRRSRRHRDQGANAIARHG